MYRTLHMHRATAALTATFAVVFAAHAADGESQPTAPTPGMNYRSLMGLSIQERLQILANVPREGRDEFVGSLPGDRRAVLLVDPDDCSGQARARRTEVALAKPKPGIAADVTKTVGHSLALGAMNFFARGLGDLVGNAARANEAAKGINGLREYRDVCDLPPEERVELLSGMNRSPEKADASLTEEASQFLAK